MTACFFENDHCLTTTDARFVSIQKCCDAIAFKVQKEKKKNIRQDCLIIYQRGLEFVKVILSTNSPRKALDSVEDMKFGQ